MTIRTILPVILAIVIILMPAASFCQHEGKARLKGTVIDPEGKPIADVNVKLYSFRADSGFETKTDKKGVWKAMWIRGGKWNLDFEKKGYEPKKVSTTLKEDAKLVVIDITLKPLKEPTIKKDMMADFDKATQFFNQGQYDNALELYAKILEEFPEAYIINLNLGNCYFEKQEYEKAIQAYLKVVEQDPQHTDCLLSIGNSYTNMKQPEKAMAWYKKIEVSKIDDPVVLYNIGIFYFNRANLDEATAFLKRAVEIKEDFTDGWYQLGMAYMGAENNEAATAAFETYLKHDSESEQAKQVREILDAIKQ